MIVERKNFYFGIDFTITEIYLRNRYYCSFGSNINKIFDSISYDFKNKTKK